MAFPSAWGRQATGDHIILPAGPWHLEVTVILIPDLPLGESNNSPYFIYITVLI
jgi:hypothetical protein